jgi:hypothetical protein
MDCAIDSPTKNGDHMNPLFKSSFLACSLLLAFAACAPKSNSNPVDNVREAGQEPDLQGKIFRGECSLKPLESIATGIATGGEAAIKSAREQYQFAGANITHATLLYQSADCTGPESIIFKETGSVSIDGDKKSKDEGKYIDIEMRALTVQISSDVGATIARDIKLCGSEDWATNTEREVTAKSAEPTCYRKQVPSRDANIYRLVDKSTLVFGEKGLLERNDTRPDSLDMDTKYVAQ